VLYGGESCSGYVKRAIAQKGLLEALSSARERFQACKRASLILRSQQSEDSESETGNHKNSQRSANNCQNPAHLCDCTLFGCETASAIPDCSLADCGSLDGASCDCAAAGLAILSPRFLSYKLYNKRPQL